MTNPAPETTSSYEARNKVWEMIKDIRIALMVTKDANGMMSARPMAAHQEKFDEELWFYTAISSPKIAEIQSDANVLLSYSEPADQNYVSIVGEASVVTDKEKIKEYWSEYLRTWFPKGVDDPEIALICVKVKGAEYWDSPSSKLLHAYGYLKAVTTGKSPDGGDNKKVQFSQSAA